jgi:NAD-dependent SIR2 family protein deacetylase
VIEKPSDKEQEYFIRLEMERLKKLREEHQRQTEQKERRRLAELHAMRCAKCGQRMETTMLEQVEIEICPDCGGIYLDAGELDKIVEDRRQGPFTNALAFARRVWRE